MLHRQGAASVATTAKRVFKFRVRSFADQRAAVGVCCVLEGRRASASRQYSTSQATPRKALEKNRKNIAFSGKGDVPNTRQAITPDLVLHAQKALRRDGVGVFDASFNVEQIQPGFVDSARRLVDAKFAEALSLALSYHGQKKGGHGAEFDEIPVGQEHGFREIVHRARGRYDMLYGVWQEPSLVEDSKLYNTLLKPAAQAILGDDCRLEFNGALVTKAGAAEQLWHADGEHLFHDSRGMASNTSRDGAQEERGHVDSEVLPAHCVNFFVPLVDIVEANAGGTEFCIGSHLYTQHLGADVVWQREDWKQRLAARGWDNETRLLRVQKGQLLCFDYRILHRALAHNVSTQRPVLYWTFVRPWFTDALNFGGLPSLTDQAAVSGTRATVSAEDEVQLDSALRTTTSSQSTRITPDTPLAARTPEWVLQLRATQYSENLVKNAGVATYADGAAGSQTPVCVADAMRNHLLKCGSTNLGGAYATSEAALQLITGARHAASAFLGCQDGSKIAFGANCTNLMFHLSRTVEDWVRRASNGSGNRGNIVVSRACHDANVAPWLLLADRCDLEVRWIDLVEGDQLDFENIETKIDADTVVAAVGLASNASGRVFWPAIRDQVAPRVESLRRDRTRSGSAGSCFPVLICDGTHYLPHFRFNLESSGADAVVCSSYKFCGPHLGVAGFSSRSPFVSAELTEGCIAKVGRRADQSDLLAAPPQPTRESYEISSWEMGTLNYEALAGLEACIVDYFGPLSGGGKVDVSDLGSSLDQAFSKIEAHEMNLSQHFLQGLLKLQHAIRFYGPEKAAGRTPTFALVPVGDFLGKDLVSFLNEKGIFCTAGNHYAPELTSRVHGESGWTRVSFLHYNTMEDVENVLDNLQKFADNSK
ncbi:unnamed protein product [Amoebophrya sp. A120]|nr:unnamed protein product [Amoebophrya sp. A120]|eukprot:GSA120T00002062001.1